MSVESISTILIVYVTCLAKVMLYWLIVCICLSFWSSAKFSCMGCITLDRYSCHFRHIFFYSMIIMIILLIRHFSILGNRLYFLAIPSVAGHLLFLFLNFSMPSFLFSTFSLDLVFFIILIYTHAHTHTQSRYLVITNLTSLLLVLLFFHFILIYERGEEKWQSVIKNRSKWHEKTLNFGSQTGLYFFLIIINIILSPRSL